MVINMSCENLLALSDLADASKNVPVLNEIVTSDLPRTTNIDSQGNTKKTLAGYALDFDAQAIEVDNMIEDGYVVIDGLEDRADEALTKIGAFDNTGIWESGKYYTANQLWQDPNDLTWYLVLDSYTSSADIATDIASGNVAIFSSAASNYSYTFINEVLGDKIIHGDLFYDADAYDIMLGKVYDGTATAAELNVTNLVDNQLGILTGAL